MPSILRVPYALSSAMWGSLCHGLIDQWAKAGPIPIADCGGNDREDRTTPPNEERGHRIDAPVLPCRVRRLQDEVTRIDGGPSGNSDLELGGGVLVDAAFDHRIDAVTGQADLTCTGEPRTLDIGECLIRRRRGSYGVNDRQIDQVTV